MAIPEEHRRCRSGPILQAVERDITGRMVSLQAKRQGDTIGGFTANNVANNVKTKMALSLCVKVISVARGSTYLRLCARLYVRCSTGGRENEIRLVANGRGVIGQ
jgi:hypothetical protein